MTKNIFYFKHINKIGGTEQFLYEIAKKYNYRDITVYYDTADESQLQRLSMYVRCKKRIIGEKIECEKAFYNFNIDIIEDVEAKEHIFISHAIYQILGYKPPINHPKLTKFIGVSQYSSNMLKEIAKEMGLDIEVETCLNPLTLEKVKKPKIIVSACRLNDEVKGGEETLKLIKALDKYCNNNLEEHYLFLIFSNPINLEIDSPNVILMKPRVDIRPFIAMADYIAQLSKDMETYCYTINEALGYGIPVITTPLSITKELKLTEDMQITLDWNCSNIDEVVEKIFNKPKKEFKYNIPLDNWDKLLAKGKPNYKEELKMRFLVEATNKYQITNTYDVMRSKEIGIKKYVPQKGERWEVDYARKEELVDKGFVVVVKEIQEKVIKVENTKKEEKNEKVSKKTTRKTTTKTTTRKKKQ